MDEARSTKVGIGILVQKDGKVLMSLRTASHGAGGYQFPGGHLEHMESFEECARREVREETGIEIENIRFTFVANVKTFAPLHYVHVGLTADWAAGDLQHLEPLKNGPWQWYDFDALPAPVFSFVDMHVQAFKENKIYFDNVL